MVIENEILNARILIVDDNQSNVELLEKMLLAGRYTSVLSTTDSREAVKLYKSYQPDLVLLDINMPYLNGFQVMEQLNEINGDDYLPVLVLTAQHDRETQLRSLELGAKDFLTRPFDQTETLTRIRNILEVRILHKQVREQNVVLVEKVNERTRELSEANERLNILDNAKSGFLQLISHELRTPLNGLFGITELLFEDEVDEETRTEFKSMLKTSKDRLLAILEDALLLTETKISGDRFKLEKNIVHNILESAIKSASGFAESRHVKLGQAPDCKGVALCDSELLTKAFSALIETAVKFSCKDSMVDISCNLMDNEIIISIIANGKVVPEEYLPEFFEVFSTSSTITQGGDLGLGPPVAESIIMLHHGLATVENLEPPGIKFTVRIPLASPEKDRFFEE